jgi:exodeoxyribonuclease VII small subunit
MEALSAKLNLALKQMTKEKISYNEAVSEIETILQKIEEGKLDVDELAEKVSRVTDLLKICRDKLYLTEKQIGKILDED